MRGPPAVRSSARAPSGGAGGSGAKYLTCAAACGVGHGSGTGGGDGGAGGAGFNYGLGGAHGTIFDQGGGGGGAGESFYNTSAAVKYKAGVRGTHYISRWIRRCGKITWLKTGVKLANPTYPSNCGMGGQQTVAIPGSAVVVLGIAGGNGGYGDNTNGTLVFGTTAHHPGGFGAVVTARYKNTSSSTVYLTAVQGCNGVEGEGSGSLAGGAGLGTGGANCPGSCGGERGLRRRGLGHLRRDDCDRHSDVRQQQLHQWGRQRPPGGRRGGVAGLRTTQQHVRLHLAALAGPGRRIISPAATGRRQPTQQ